MMNLNKACKNKTSLSRFINYRRMPYLFSLFIPKSYAGIIEIIGQRGNSFCRKPALVLLCSIIPAFSFAQKITTGGWHSIAICNDSTAWAWGRNSTGQLGDSSNTDKTVPVQVHGTNNSGFLKEVISVSAGVGYSIALKKDSTVWAWGRNASGQLGDSSKTDKIVPVQVHGPNNIGFLTGIVAIAAGREHVLALKKDSTVWAWGMGSTGALGDNAGVWRWTPVQVHGAGNVGFLTGIVAIAAGNTHSLALKADGTVWAWGGGGNGQLGNNTIAPYVYVPVQVHNVGNAGFLTGITAIAVSDNNSMALKNDGTVVTWGWNLYGQLGDNTIANRSTPVQVHGPNNSGLLTDVMAVGMAWHFTIALKADGTVWAWGRNQYGQLGDGSNTQSNTPVQVHGFNNVGFLTGITAIATGYYHALAMKNDGTLWAWGNNNFGELGNGQTNVTGCYCESAPVQVNGLCAVTAVTPVADFSTNQTEFCANSCINFTDKSKNADSWLWNFEGGMPSSSTAQTPPPICYSAAGEYNVTLITGNVNGADTMKRVKYIKVNPSVTASVSISSSDTTVCAGTTVIFSATPANGGASPLFQWKVNGIDAGANSSVYSSDTLEDDDEVSCTMTSGENCVSGSPASSAPIRITVNPVPSAGTVSAVRDTICEGTPAILTVTGSTGNIQWQSSAYASTGFSDIPAAVNPSYTEILPQKTYFRVYASNGSCTDTSASYPVMVNPSPVAEFSYTVTERKVTLSNNSTGATRYNWSFDDGSPSSAEENPVHHYTSDGTYHVCLEALNGSNCSFTTCQDIFIGMDAAVTLSEPVGWQLFPNPAGDVIYITGKKQEDMERIELSDIQGRKMLMKDFSGANVSNAQINLSSLAAGMYLLKIKSKDENNMPALFRIFITK